MRSLIFLKGLLVKNPKISVIIPVYNVEKYLPQCLDSIINQTLKDIEIIVVNDCSPDNSELIILDYMSQDSRFVYIKHETNTRQGGARNTGILAAKGEWIFFIDPDDYLSLNLLEKMLSKCLEIGANFGISGIRLFDDANPRKTWTWILPFKKIDGKILNDQYLNDVYVGAVPKLYKTKDLIDNHIFFPENIIAEDWLFNYYYITKVQPKIGVVNEYSYFYRQHSNSTMNNMKTNVIYLPVVAEQIVTYLIESNLWELYRIPFLKELPMRFRWILNIEQSYIEKFLENFTQFCNAIDMTDDDIQKFPLFCFGYLSNMPISQKKILLKELAQNFEINDNKWYRFGQKSFYDKIKMIIRFLLNKFDNILN